MNLHLLVLIISLSVFCAFALLDVCLEQHLLLEPWAWLYVCAWARVTQFFVSGRSQLIMRQHTAQIVEASVASDVDPD